MNDLYPENLDESNDYASDFSSETDDILNNLLSGLPVESQSDTELAAKDVPRDETPCEGEESHHHLLPEADAEASPLAAEDVGVSVEFDGGSAIPAAATADAESKESYGRRAAQSVTSELGSQPSEPLLPDLRSPLERFREAPMKTLSVTDLVSPSWCELQYWYTLTRTKYGRKRPTPAMKQGSAVHQTLEDQVHRSVAVDIQTKEDAWGLRILNVIEGLKTLRDTGLTRELELWGVLDGLVVNGVIDELSYICPDRELEEEVTARTAHGKVSKGGPPLDQTSITSFMNAAGGQNSDRGVIKNLKAMRKRTSKIYLADVKTRGVKAVPNGASFRPTLMQLMLYHRLFSDMATNKVDASTIFKRYNLNSDKAFSDSFIAEVGNLKEVFYDASPEPSQDADTPDSAQDTMQLLLDHNSLRQLWNLMIQEFQRTLPTGADGIGNILKVEYRDQVLGTISGIKTFINDANVLQTYLDAVLSWWRGEREAQGVCIEEAYKCRSCEFAEGCDWRKAKINEATQAHRTRSRSLV